MRSINKPAFQIFPDKARMISQGLCPICGRKIKESEFRDEKSRREYLISGLCQACQDEIFGED